MGLPERCRAEHKLPYPLVFLDPMAANVLKVAQSKLEWLRDTLMRVFDHTRENPFACRRASIAMYHEIS